MSRLFTSLLMIVVTFASCKKDENNAPLIRNDAQLAASLKSCPENIVLGSNHIYLHAAVWRDFMPGGGAPMICFSLLMDRDTLPLPASIKLKQQYLIKGDMVWSGPYLETGTFPPAWLKGWTDEGPKWNPGDYVDVVCEFEYERQTVRLLDKSVVIGSVQ